MPISNGELNEQLTLWALHQTQWLEQVQDWWAGTPTGGPNGDGLYPFTTYDGVERLVPCPAIAGTAPVGGAGGGTSGGSSAYDIVLRYFEQPGASQVLDFVWLVRPITLSANLNGAVANQLISPLVARTFTLRTGGSPLSGLDGDQIATMTVQPAGTWTFATTGQVSIPAGTLLKLVGPPAADAAMQGVFLTLKGEAA
jgi:hypothetical protein